MIKFTPSSFVWPELGQKELGKDVTRVFLWSSGHVHAPHSSRNIDVASSLLLKFKTPAESSDLNEQTPESSRVWELAFELQPQIELIIDITEREWFLPELTFTSPDLHSKHCTEQIAYRCIPRTWAWVEKRWSFPIGITQIAKMYGGKLFWNSFSICTKYFE